jgi:hypothetical protein
MDQTSKPQPTESIMKPFTIVYYRNTNLEGTVLAVKDTDFGKRYQVCWKHNRVIDWYSEEYISQ